MAHAPSLAYVGFAKQTVHGTPVAPTKFVRWQTLDARERIDMGNWRNGLNRDFSIAAKLGQYHDLSFSTFLYPDIATALYNFALGGSDSLTGGSDPYTHNFQTAETVLPEITFEHSMGHAGTALEIERVPDCLVDRIRLMARAHDVANVEINIKGRQGVRQASAATVSFETDRPPTYVDGTLTLTGLDVASADVTELEIDLNNHVEQVWAYGSFAPQLIATARDMDCNFTVFVPDDKLWREVFFGSATGTTAVSAPTYLTTLVAKFDLGGTPDHYVQITLNNIVMNDAIPIYDVNAKAFMVQAKGRVIRPTSGSFFAVESKNAYGVAYV